MYFSQPIIYNLHVAYIGKTKVSYDLQFLLDPKSKKKFSYQRKTVPCLLIKNLKYKICYAIKMCGKGDSPNSLSKIELCRLQNMRKLPLIPSALYILSLKIFFLIHSNFPTCDWWV